MLWYTFPVEREINGAAEREWIAVAFCAVGVEKVLAQELRRLNLSIEESGFGRVRFRAGLAGLYRALIALRTADRVLLEAAFFSAANFDDLFEGVRAVPWEGYIPQGMGLTVTKVRSGRSVLKAETSIQAVVHKAAAGRLCNAHGVLRLPEDGKTASLRVFIDKDQVSLLLDLSGEPLFKRGYRLEGGAAPLRETTAAALLQLALWRRKFPLYDPFCGSGTILAEAALYAWDAAPGLGRRFALGDLLIADPALETSIRAEFLGRVNFERTVRIFGSDRDSRAVSAANSNIRRARDLALGGAAGRGTAEGGTLPELRCLPMEEARAPLGAADRGNTGGEGETGFIITNPPYGKRLGEPGEAEACYTAMAALARGFPRWKLAVISDHPGFESFFGRGADSCRELSSGALQSYFFQYRNL